MSIVTVRQLLDNGVHFGHQTRRWNPKMKDYIFIERNGIHIIDLQKSIDYINLAFSFVKNTVSKGGKILFVGTKKQAQDTIEKQANRAKQPYVNQRWLGGMLTNFYTVSKRIDRLKDLEKMNFSKMTKSESGYTKREALLLEREKNKLKNVLGGIKSLNKIPSILWIVDTKKEHIAIEEAKKLNIPVVAILDTNCDPDEVKFPILGNDDAIRSINLLTQIIANAALEGSKKRERSLKNTSHKK